jgi:hypothetical protein
VILKLERGDVEGQGRVWGEEGAERVREERGDLGGV